MNSTAPFPPPAVTRLPPESSVTSPFDWLLLLGFPPEAASRSLGLPATPPPSPDEDPPREAA